MYACIYLYTCVCVCVLQISKFLQFVKKIYSDLPNTMVTLFEPGGSSGSDDASGKGSSVSLTYLSLV